MDEHLDDGCDHSLTLTDEFLKEKGIENTTKVLEWRKKMVATVTVKY